jgi:hypothetical protein
MVEKKERRCVISCHGRDVLGNVLADRLLLIDKCTESARVWRGRDAAKGATKAKDRVGLGGGSRRRRGCIQGRRGGRGRRNYGQKRRIWLDTFLYCPIIVDGRKFIEKEGFRSADLLRPIMLFLPNWSLETWQTVLVSRKPLRP